MLKFSHLAIAACFAVGMAFTVPAPAKAELALEAFEPAPEPSPSPSTLPKCSQAEPSCGRGTTPIIFIDTTLQPPQTVTGCYPAPVVLPINGNKITQKTACTPDVPLGDNKLPPNTQACADAWQCTVVGCAYTKDGENICIRKAK